MMTTAEKISRMVKKKEQKLKEICLDCNVWPCRGNCQKFKTQSAAVKKWYKIKVAKIKAQKSKGKK